MNSASSALTVIPAALSSALSSVQSYLPEPVLGVWSDAVSRLEPAYSRLPAPLQKYLSSLSHSIDPDHPESAALSCTLIAVLLVAMAGWGRNFWPTGGRFSPFGASASAYPPQVSDEDYSYITADDITAPQPAYDQSRPSHVPHRPSTTDDIILLKIDGLLRPVHFAPYSIDDGILSVADLRHEAAKIIGVDSRRVRLLYKGRTLRDETKPCRDEGLKIDSEVLCVVSEEVGGDHRGSGYSESVDDGEGSYSEADGAGAEAGGTSSRRKRNNRNRKKKSKKSPTGSGGTNSPHLAPPETATSSSSRSTSPAPPKSPHEKLGDISSFFKTKLLPQSIQFTTHPPTDPTKRDHEHKWLTETILSQVLLKLDAVETEGDPEARQRRKDLVKETQGVLNELDAVMKRGGL